MIKKSITKGIALSLFVIISAQAMDKASQLRAEIAQLEAKAKLPGNTGAIAARNLKAKQAELAALTGGGQQGGGAQQQVGGGAAAGGGQQQVGGAGVGGGAARGGGRQLAPLGQQWTNYLTNAQNVLNDPDQLEVALDQFRTNIKDKGYDLTGLENFEAVVSRKIADLKRRSTGGGRAPGGVDPALAKAQLDLQKANLQIADAEETIRELSAQLAAAQRGGGAGAASNKSIEELIYEIGQLRQRVVDMITTDPGLKAKYWQDAGVATVDNANYNINAPII